jgi:hypothetical protein
VSNDSGSCGLRAGCPSRFAGTWRPRAFRWLAMLGWVFIVWQAGSQVALLRCWRWRFDEVLAGNGIRIIRTPGPVTPGELTRGAVETLRRECLDHLLIYGELHLRQILVEYAQRDQTGRKASIGLSAPS